MRDFLKRLVERNAGAAETIRPKLPSRFETLRTEPLALSEESVELPAADDPPPLRSHSDPPFLRNRRVKRRPPSTPSRAPLSTRRERTRKPASE